MELNKVTLAAHIRASTVPAVVAALAIRNDVALADLYNEPSAFIVWRTRRSKAELRADAVVGAGEMDNLEAGKRDALFWLLSDDINPSDAAVRSAFVDLTANRSGGYVATALRASLSAGAKRAATLCESVFATGTGTTAVPGQLTYEGLLTHTDISAALNAPV